MIESLFKELLSLPNDEKDERDKVSESPASNDSEDSFLAALPVVRKIVRRKILFPEQSDSSDMVQRIALRLWKWRDKFREKSEEMSPEEWRSFAARTAYNEINRHFSNKTILKDVPLDADTDFAAQKSVEGESDAEVYSLVRLVWQEICQMSLRQRRALLLNSQESVVYFLKFGIGDEELARILNFTMNEWVRVKENLPLLDIQIAKIIKEKGNQKSVEAIANSIKKARHEARAKMRRVTDG